MPKGLGAKRKKRLANPISEYRKGQELDKRQDAYDAEQLRQSAVRKETDLQRKQGEEASRRYMNRTKKRGAVRAGRRKGKRG